MANDAEARSLLKDVTLEGTVTIPKRKLLWLVDWVHDRPGAWKALLDQWEQIGQERHSLYGFEVHDKIVLAMKTGQSLEPVSNWEKD